jgi:hypothetical protein
MFDILTQSQQTMKTLIEPVPNFLSRNGSTRLRNLMRTTNHRTPQSLFLLRGPIVVASYRKRKRDQNRDWDRDPIFALHKGPLEANISHVSPHPEHTCRLETPINH